MRTIGGVFGSSPYGPVHEMMVKVQQCLEKLPDLLAAQAAADWARLDAVRGEIDRFESQADDIKREIRRHLSTSPFTAVQRSELIALTHSQDEVADMVQDAARTACLRRTGVPQELSARYADQGEALVAAGATLVAVTARLAGSDGVQAAAASATPELDRVGRVEADCRSGHDALLRELLAMEGKLPVMDMLFLMDIIRGLGRVADQLENVAGGLVMVLGSR